MLKDDRYPSLSLRSKNEITKRISNPRLSLIEALSLINKVLNNYDKYWRDVKSFSEPEKDKYVRSAKGTSLGRILSLIDKKILAPSDKLIPEFISGGVSSKSHVQAAYYLLGKRRKRTKLGLDITRFFEQNGRERVFAFFYVKCKCSKKAANILANLCCVPMGAKNSGEAKKILARGFPTSTRLALWCNLDLFLRIYWKAKQLLKGF